MQQKHRSIRRCLWAMTAMVCLSYLSSFGEIQQGRDWQLASLQYSQLLEQCLTHSKCPRKYLVESFLVHLGPEHHPPDKQDEGLGSSPSTHPLLISESSMKCQHPSCLHSGFH